MPEQRTNPQRRRDGLDALLVMCPTWDTSLPPINIAYLAAYCRQEGFNIALMDLNIRLANVVRHRELRGLWNFLAQNLLSAEEATDRFYAEVPEVINGFVDQIRASGAPCVGFSIHSRNTAFTERVVGQLRERGSDQRFVYGGPEVLARLSTSTLGELSADAYVVGEGEQTLAELLAGLRRHGEVEPIDGLIVARGGGLTELKPRPPVMNLDAIPFPCWEDFDLTSYDAEAIDSTVPFLFSRGCTGKCAFCMDHLLAGRYRCRTPENAVEEIRRIVRRFNVRQFHFNDLLCNGNLRKLEALSDLIIDEELEITWWSYAVVRKGLSPELFAKLRRSGCSAVVFGLESGSDRVLKAMNKHYTAADAEEALRHCAASGINTGINIIVGFPGETVVEHQETLDFIERNRATIHRVVNLGSCILSPGSALQTSPERFGIERDAEGGTWRAGDNTLEERDRRLAEVRDLLDRCSIPRVVLNRELADGRQPQQSSGELDRETQVRIIDVDFLDARGRRCQRFETGDQLTLVIRFQVDRPQVEPVFRVQLFNDQNPARENLFVFGSNTNRMRVRTGQMDTGMGEARLTLGRLNLRAGTYTCTAGIWPHEEAQTAFDVHHGGHRFRILGRLDPSGATVHSELTWRVAPAGEADTEPDAGTDAGTNRIERVTVGAPGGGERPHHGPRQQVLLRAGCSLPEPEQVRIRASILRGGLRVQHALYDAPLPAGSVDVELLYAPLNLLDGAYVVELSLLDRATSEELHTVTQQLQVRSAAVDGAGLAFIPCSWEIRAPRRE